MNRTSDSSGSRNTLPINRRHEGLHKDSQSQLRFETLLADISARFVNVPAGQVDSEIENTQRLVCEFHSLDLSALWQRSDATPDSFTLTHLYRSVEGPPPPERMDAQEYFPWSLQKLMTGKVLALSSIGEIPAEASRDREVYRYCGIKTTLTIPLSTGGRSPFGLLSFNTMLAERSWPDEIVKRLQLVAQVFANALARKRAEEALRQSEQLYRMVADNSHDWEYLCAPDGLMLYVSNSCERITGYTSQEFMDDPSLLRKIIVSEDQGGWDKHHHYTQTEREGQGVQFRIRRRDGEIRWIDHVCQRTIDGSGDFFGVRGTNRDITDRKEMEISLQKAYEEIKRLKKQLEEENLYLQKEIKQEKGFDEIIGKSNVLNYIFFRVRQVAGTVSTVLLLGETGTGKELIAHAIHNHSPRKEKIIVTVNCAALPSSLIESELFGREKGAFTGSHAKQIGRFELAHGGTIFLDEIGELPLELQSKLLKVVQDGAFERLGSPHTTKVDVRIIASTNRNLEDMVQKGRFRGDLYYRLNIFPITIPPLRQRKDDIPLLVEHFTKYFAQRHGIKIKKISQDLLSKLQGYQWPGNVRELQNVIERAVITSPGDVLRVEIPEVFISGPEDIKPLDDLERDHICKVLEKTKGRIAGPQGAAILLGMNPSTLRSRLIKLGIKKRGFRSA